MASFRDAHKRFDIKELTVIKTSTMETCQTYEPSFVQRTLEKCQRILCYMQTGFLTLTRTHSVGVIYSDGVHLNLIWIRKYFAYRDGFRWPLNLILLQYNNDIGCFLLCTCCLLLSAAVIMFFCLIYFPCFLTDES